MWVVLEGSFGNDFAENWRFGWVKVSCEYEFVLFDDSFVSFRVSSKYGIRPVAEKAHQRLSCVTKTTIFTEDSSTIQIHIQPSKPSNHQDPRQDRKKIPSQPWEKLESHTVTKVPSPIKFSPNKPMLPTANENPKITRKRPGRNLSINVLSWQSSASVSTHFAQP